MSNHSGPLLRDLIATADHPVGNIPPAPRLRDFVGTAVDLDYRVPTSETPAYRIPTMLDVLTEWAQS